MSRSDRLLIALMTCSITRMLMSLVAHLADDVDHLVDLDVVETRHHLVGTTDTFGCIASAFASSSRLRPGPPSSSAR
ncbi:hypothetical protein BN961_01828 [Afipia felis]|uniref:Secreted protein n=1 Tax=Afipia felis TaxID=1035 RepID=A0A090N7D5_AFIFE|nr:hypothetical protein BN961_01828 [Afipia felis]